MIKVAVISGLVLGIAGFGTGMILSKDGASEEQARRARPTSPVVAKPGAGVALAGQDFLKANPPPLAFNAAAPTDIALTFRRELSAIMGTGRNLYLSMKTNGVGAAHPLRRGQEYQEGWILTRLTTGEATLTKGDESRTVFLYSAAETPNQTTPVSATVRVGSFGQTAGGAGGPGGRGGGPGGRGAVQQGGFVANINNAGRGGQQGGFGGGQQGGRGGQQGGFGGVNFGGGAFGGGQQGGRGGGGRGG